MDASALRLKVIHSTDALLHEHTDPKRVERLSTAILDDGFLRNPPIAAEIAVAGQKSRYVILDGATRTTALRQADVRDILVQVVNYAEGVKLQTWHHVLRISANQFYDKLIATDLFTIDRGVSSQPVVSPPDGAICSVLCNSGEYMHVYSKATPPVALSALVAQYINTQEIFRLAQSELERIIEGQHTTLSVVIFPTFKHTDIINFALQEQHLPSGITRHIIAGRAINFDISIDLLTSGDPLSVKNSIIAKRVQRKVIEKKVRYYEEPVFVFDE